MEKFDILIAFNQDFPVGEIIRVIGGSDRHALLLSSHELFENEKRAIRGTTSNVKFHTFSDLLSDAELEEIDNRASAALKNAPSFTFISLFSEAIIFEKNAQAFAKLQGLYGFSEVHAYCGLGISPRFWSAQRARLHGSTAFSASFNPIAKLKAILSHHFGPKEVHSVLCENDRYVFYGPVRRLRFAEGILLERLIVRNFNKGYRRMISQKGKEKVIASTTIHGFTSPDLLAVNDLHVFIDGFHPPNYTRSYIDIYGDPIFVTRTMFDARWFSRNGKRTKKLPALVRKEWMSHVQSAQLIRNVIVLLNHGGDWSALINRSDTDRLISACVLLSQNHDHTNFIIRVHPTMIHDSHEGRNSINRIQKFVQWVNRPNLSVSQVELQTDFDRGDVFISEYSQTAIDAACMGKRILIANFTGRRSLMQCYEEIGFSSVCNQEQLESWFQQLMNNVSQHDDQQNRAVDLYNSLLDSYLAGEST